MLTFGRHEGASERRSPGAGLGRDPAAGRQSLLTRARLPASARRPRRTYAPRKALTWPSGRRGDVAGAVGCGRRHFGASRPAHSARRPVPPERRLGGPLGPGASGPPAAGRPGRPCPLPVIPHRHDEEEQEGEALDGGQEEEVVVEVAAIDVAWKRDKRGGESRPEAPARRPILPGSSRSGRRSAVVGRQDAGWWLGTCGTCPQSRGQAAPSPGLQGARAPTHPALAWEPAATAPTPKGGALPRRCDPALGPHSRAQRGTTGVQTQRTPSVIPSDAPLQPLALAVSPARRAQGMLAC